MENKKRRKSTLDRLSLAFFDFLKSSWLGRFFTSYEKANDKFLKITAKKKKTAQSVWRKGIIHELENNIIAKAIRSFFHFLLRTSLRDYGIMLFIMGALTAGLYPLNGMVSFLKEVPFENLVYGLAICVVSLPLLFSARSLAWNILNSKLFSGLIFEFLGYDDEGIRVNAEKNRVTYTNVSALIGLALGILSYFFSPVKVLIIVASIVLAYLIFRAPETGAIITIFALPFVAINYIKIIIIYTAISYLAKLFVRKRIIGFELLDLFVTATLVALFLCGMDYSSPLSALDYFLDKLIILLVYFICSNLVRSKDWFKRVMVSLTSSALIVAIVGIVQFIIGELSQIFEILQVAFNYDGKISSTFESNENFALYMIVAIPFTLVHMFSEKKELNKFVGFLMSAVLIVGLALANSQPAILGLIVGALLLLIVFNRNYIYLAILLVLSIPICRYALPLSIREQISSLEFFKSINISDVLEKLKEGFLLFLEHPLGIGVVEAQNIDSLGIRFLVTYGAVGTIFAIAFCIVFSRLIFSYCAKAKNKYRKINCSVGFCSLIAIFTTGIFTDVWADDSIFLISVICCALSFAYIKIERENECAEESFLSLTEAEIDIELPDDDEHEYVYDRKYVHAPKNKKAKNIRNREVKEFSNTEDLIRLVEIDLDKYENDE